MSAADILDRLDAVRETGAGRWIARCPAHEDRSPSLSIRECDDGAVLLHCFAGCSAVDIVTAIGVEFADLFPAGQIRRVDRHARGVPRLSAAERLELIDHEVTTACIVLADILAGSAAPMPENEKRTGIDTGSFSGVPGTDERWTRLAHAAARIRKARYA